MFAGGLRPNSTSPVKMALARLNSVPSAAGSSASDGRVWLAYYIKFYRCM